MNMQFARATLRAKELAVRSSLGATRSRLIRQMLTESLLLALAGGAAGGGLAWGGIRLLVGLAPTAPPRLGEIGIDARVLVVAALVAVTAGVVFSILPLLRYRLLSLAGVLKEGGRASTAGRERHRARNVLVVSQVALALVLLAGSAALGPGDRPPLLRDVGIEPRLGAPVPLDLAFRDEDGKAVTLARYFGERPVVLSLVYFGCPMLCGQVLESLGSSLKPLALEPGRDFDVLTVSFDPRDGPAAARAKRGSVLSEYQREGAAQGWRFLTGGEESIARLTAAVGFRYVWDPKSEQFAHPTGLVALTPAGRISKYLFGLEAVSRDVRLALMESAEEKIGSATDRFLLLCYRYDPKLGRYTVTALNLVRGGAVLTVAVLAGYILLMLRRERKARRA